MREVLARAEVVFVLANVVKTIVYRGNDLDGRKLGPLPPCVSCNTRRR